MSQAVIISDFDSNGKPDIIVDNQGSSDWPTNTVFGSS